MLSEEGERRSHSPGLEPSPKKQCQHPDHWGASEQFWDTLPKIYLTRRALNELDRRNCLQDSELQDSELQIPTKEQLVTNVELRRFARQGGPDLTSIRGFPVPTMNGQSLRPRPRPRPSRGTTDTPPMTGTPQAPSSPKTGPYDAHYQMQLAQNGIFLTEEKDENGNIVLPNNYDKIITRLNKRRRSLSPSRFTEADFQKFRTEVQPQMLEPNGFKSVSIIEGTAQGIYSFMGGKFNNLELFDDDLKKAVPDSYDGAPPLSINPQVFKDLSKTIIPSTESFRPAAPNFFLEGKSKKGRGEVAIRQAAYTGAIGARGMVSLQCYPSQALTYDGNAYSFTSTYQAGVLNMYTYHVTAPTTVGDLPQYHMTQLNSFGMTGEIDTFRKGATWYRNARDLAKEQRDMFIQQANQRAEQTLSPKRGSRNHSTTDTLSVRTSSQTEEQENSDNTDAATDELALDKVSMRLQSATLYHDEDEEKRRK